MFKEKNSVIFGCFSPPVMIATFIFEIISMFYVLVRYKLNTRSRLIALLLLNLGIFQLSEFFVCQNSMNAEIASRVGYVAITLLPALGLHLMAEISKAKIKFQLVTAYVLALSIGAYFLLHPDSFQSFECTGNYVIFQIGRIQGLFYGIYYFGLILATFVLGFTKLKIVRGKDRRDINMLILGYLVFIIPVAVLTVLHPDTRQAIPSVLCGFAVFFAIILVTKVAPLALKKR